MFKPLLLSLLTTVGLIAAPAPQATNTEQNPDDKYKIQVAILLDVSGSMDGLIEQAKSQLWKMVNTLASTKYNGKTPEIEIALYEYGKSSLSSESGYIREIVPMSNDLDKVSEELFALKTNGGDEYCGQVILKAVQDLKWSDSKADLKIINIAGNEPFTQGTVDYKNACKTAIEKGIIVNTIFCGQCEEGIRTNWKDGADLADGEYLCINHDEKVVHIPTPFDDEILRLNGDLNKTYIGFGSSGREMKERQEVQDANAAEYGASNMAQRAASKSSAAYDNSSWDIVDAYKKDKKAVTNAKKEELPEELKGKSEAEIEKFVEAKKAEREAIQKQIQDLNKQAEAFREVERAKAGETNTLDGAMKKAMLKQAESKGYNVGN